MKFGHNLPRNQVPEWAASYINYKGLKKLIKTAAEASKHGSDLDLAGERYHPRCTSCSKNVLCDFHRTAAGFA